MTLKDIARQVVQYDDTFSCKIQRNKNQILVTCNDWPDEVVTLLSPYYQDKIARQAFSQKDLEGILAEVDRIRLYGI